MKKNLKKVALVFTAASFIFVSIFSSCKSTKQDNSEAETEAVVSVPVETAEEPKLSRREARKAAKEAKAAEEAAKKAEKEAKKAEKAAKKAEKKKKKEAASEDSVAEQKVENSSEAAAENIKETQEEKTSENEKKQKEEDKNFIGWIPEGRGNVNVQLGNVKLSARGKNGSFNIYSLDYDGKATAGLSNIDEFTRTSFYLKAGNKVYKLADGAGVGSSCGKSDDGIKMVYVIPKVAKVSLEFKIMKTDKDRAEDLVKISASVQNLKKKTENFALKLVLDTVLGEKSQYHFYTSDGLPVKSEYLFRSAKRTRWIQCGNERTSLQVLLDGADITPQDYVAVAAYDTLATLEWDPVIQPKRAFDNVISYNNSAIGLNWISKDLETEAEYKEVFYIAVSAYPVPINGDGFIKAYEEAHKKVDEAEENPVVSADPAVTEKSGPVIIYATPDLFPGIKIDSKTQNETTVSSGNNSGTVYIKDSSSTDENESVIPEREIPEAYRPVPEKVVEAPVEIKAVPEAEFKVITDRQLQPEYIQGLLNRIAELEEDSSTTSHEELLRLSRELDMILEKLRNQ